MNSNTMKRYSFILPLLFLTLLFVLLFSCDGEGSDRTNFRVREVIDGDTVVLDNKSATHLRYLGIDAPEALTIDSPADPLADEAKKLNRKLVEGKEIKVEFDEEKYDSYGRLLGYVFIDDVFVNELILRKGLAHLLIIEPNSKYEKVLEKAQKRAVSEGVGIWDRNYSYELPKENERFLIKPVNATRHIDQRVLVRGKITEVRSNRHVIKLNMEDEIDIVIFRNNRSNFDYLGIDPYTDYTGKPLEVTGTIRMYRGRPQIIVDHPISLRNMD